MASKRGPGQTKIEIAKQMTLATIRVAGFAKSSKVMREFTFADTFRLLSRQAGFTNLFVLNDAGLISHVVTVGSDIHKKEL